MLTLTENASTIVNELSSQTEAPEAGLRTTVTPVSIAVAIMRP